VAWNLAEFHVELGAGVGEARHGTLSARDGCGRMDAVKSFLHFSKRLATPMRHLKQIDGEQRTAIMMQVENEIGFLSPGEFGIQRLRPYLC
jgi:hypothetical protein